MKNKFLNGSGDEQLKAATQFLNAQWTTATAENRFKYMSALSVFEKKQASMLVTEIIYKSMSDAEKTIYHRNLEVVKRKIEKKKNQLFKQYILHD